MIKKHFKMLCTMALLSLFLQQSAIASTMYLMLLIIYLIN